MAFAIISLMDRRLFFSKYQKAISFVLVFVIVFSAVMIPPKKAVAQGGLAGCLMAGVGSVLAAAVSGTMVPVNNFIGNMKEQCLDGLFVVLNEMVIKKISADVIDWINTGFDGNPAFVEDFDKFGQDIVDREVGTFLESSELAFLCSPFQAQIKIALSRANSRGGNGAFQKSISCSLDDVSNNVQNFLDGDFADGGWDAWTRLSYNNPYSDYLKVSLELEGRKLGALEGEREKVLIGRGFLSSAQPDDTCVAEVKQNIADWYAKNPPDPNETELEKKAREEQDQKDIKNTCPDKIVTPGSVIEEQLNHTLQLGTEKLIVADEINEIFDALLSHLINEALTKGLKSLSKKDDSGQSYNEKSNSRALPSGEGIEPSNPDSFNNENPQFNPTDYGLPADSGAGSSQ